MPEAASATTLAGLKALTGKDWSALGLTQTQADSLLDSFDATVKAEGDAEAMKEVAAEVWRDLMEEAGQPTGEGEGEEPGEDDGEPREGEGWDGEGEEAEGQAEGPQEGSGEATEGAEEQAEGFTGESGEFDLARYIVATAKKNRDTILEGMEFGGKGTRITIKMPDLPEVTFDRAHALLPTLVKVTAFRKPVLLVGAAGSGKTTAGQQVAQTYGVQFIPNSNSPMDTYTKAFGYMNGSGRYQPGYLYTAMKHGGVLLDDEVDASNPSVMVSKNAAIENRYALFPNGEKVEAHPDFIYIGSANTFGRGADRLYVGRTQLDAATLDRFINIVWDYDEDLELSIAPDEAWTKHVQAIRKVVFDHKMRYVVSPRASINGGLLLSAGFKKPQVEEMVVFKGWPADDVAKVKRALKG